MKKTIQKYLKLIAFTLIVVIVILICIYAARIHFIYPEHIFAGPLDREAARSIRITGTGPGGRSFELPGEKDSLHWNTGDFYLYSINIYLPAAFLKSDLAYLKYNGQYYYANQIRGHLPGKKINDDPLVIKIHHNSNLSFPEKILFVLPEIAAAAGGSFFTAPLIFVFLVILFIFDFSQRRKINKTG